MLGRELGRKAVATQAHARNVVARLRPVAGRRQVAFQGARPLVRVFAAEPAAGEAAPKAAPKAAPSMTLEEVKEGGEYEGTVEAVEDFGAFVNFGTTTNGLIHISKLSAGFTKNAKDVVSPGQKVTVTVLSVDAEKKRVSLSLKQAPGADAGSSAPARADKSDGDTTYSLDNPDEGEVVEEDVEVELDDGQFEVRSDLPGFESIPFVMEEDDDELTDASITAMEANMDDIEEEVDLPIYTLGDGDIDERAKAFVEDLMGSDEDEAELPARAARRPAVLAAAVQNIAASAVKALRDKTGAGMMDCKKALGECAGDTAAAEEWLRKKGLSGADKKAGRIAAEGAIVRYIHPGSRLGVLLEVNCETDFVAASEKFTSLVGELGMIIAATDCICVSPEDVPAEVESLNSMGLAALGTNEVDFDGDEVALFEYWSADAYDNIPKDILKRMGLKMSFNDQGEAEFADREGYVLAKEREVELGKDDLAAKPEAIRNKIVEGRLEKMRNQIALTNQMTLSNPDKTVGELVKETIAAVGENIKIRRFTKFRLGEGLEKRSNDFAAEVAQQTQAKAAAPKPKEEPKKEEPAAPAKPLVQGKPEAIRAKIAEGRAKKIATEMCLLDQPFLTDNSKTVADAIKEATAAIGEKISVRRFVKYQLGEGLEKRSNDFAAEVAAATAKK
ncbi:Elongation factor Ts [Tetrabaena socialis]|uniref:Elongation factor Ts, mitochondrial n=1 Tax=Tetrabaena socialis TaxID=47790 RepID=A0A2J8A263_9CHLO|nr:Elongation factor Ts [Tetrabaena socialis]|eukprot:PNH06607.1 Elongation factor Ts [Tetrabaena socialis]